MKKRIFFAIPKSPTQMGSLSVKNASEKFSRLGTFKVVPVWTPRSQDRIVEADLGSKLSMSTDEWCVDRRDLANVFSELNYFLNFDCMATRKNSVCKKFYSKIPQIGSDGVDFLCQELKPDVQYFCCPPVKLIGRVVGHLLSCANVNCLLIVPVWPSTAF